MFEIYSNTEEKRFTYSDYAAMDDDKRYELIDGKLFMSPAPMSLHQWIQFELAYLMENYIRKNKKGRVFVTSTDVILDEDNTVQPDILFISKENLSKIKKKVIFGAPDLVVEIISPGSQQRDRFIKKDLYKKFGVIEYWIVDTDIQSVEVYYNSGGNLDLFSFAVKKGKIESHLFPDLEILIEDIFPEFDFIM